jgi:hypothetical protein
LFQVLLVVLTSPQQLEEARSHPAIHLALLALEVTTEEPTDITENIIMEVTTEEPADITENIIMAVTRKIRVVSGRVATSSTANGTTCHSKSSRSHMIRSRVRARTILGSSRLMATSTQLELFTSKRIIM